MGIRIFDKSISRMVQGIALILMIFHHQFSQPFNHSSIFGDFSFVEYKIAWFGKICVAIFCFISGYGITNSFVGNNSLKDMYKNVFVRIIDFLKIYWFVLLVCSPFYIIIGKVTLNRIIMGLTMYDTSFNGALWYARQYIFLLLEAPSLYCILLSIKKKNGKQLLVGVSITVCIVAFVHIILNRGSIVYLLIFVEGMICDTYNIFDKLNVKCKEFGKALHILGLLIMVIVRMLISRQPGDCLMDLFLIIPFIYFLASILKECCIGLKSI